MPVKKRKIISEVDLCIGKMTKCPIAYIYDDGNIFIQESRLVNGSAEFDKIELNKAQLERLYKKVFGD